MSFVHKEYKRYNILADNDPVSPIGTKIKRPNYLNYLQITIYIIYRWMIIIWKSIIIIVITRHISYTKFLVGAYTYIIVNFVTFFKVIFGFFFLKKPLKIVSKRKHLWSANIRYASNKSYAIKLQNSCRIIEIAYIRKRHVIVRECTYCRTLSRK